MRALRAVGNAGGQSDQPVVRALGAIDDEEPGEGELKPARESLDLLLELAIFEGRELVEARGDEGRVCGRAVSRRAVAGGLAQRSAAGKAGPAVRRVHECTHRW